MSQLKHFDPDDPYDEHPYGWYPVLTQAPPNWQDKQRGSND